MDKMFVRRRTRLLLYGIVTVGLALFFGFGSFVPDCPDILAGQCGDNWASWPFGVGAVILVMFGPVALVVALTQGYGRLRRRLSR